MATRTLEQKIGDWDRAFQAIRDTVVPKAAREFVAQGADIKDLAGLRSYQGMAHVVAAGDRTAAIAAAIIVSSPLKFALDPSVYEEDEPGSDEDGGPVG